MKIRGRSIWSLMFAFLLSCILVLLLASCKMSKSSYVNTLSGSRVRLSGSGSPQAVGVSSFSGDEIWVVARHKESASAEVEDGLGSGALIARLEEKQIP